MFHYLIYLTPFKPCVLLSFFVSDLCCFEWSSVLMFIKSISMFNSSSYVLTATTTAWQFGSSNSTIIQTQTSKTTQKAQNQASAMAIPVLWPEPCRKWVRWTEEKKHRHGAVNLKDLERFWMKEWSLISCQVFSNLIRHYRRTFRAVKLANGGFKKYWIKGCR